MATHIGNEGSVYIGSNKLAETRSWRLNTAVAIVDDSAIDDAWDTHKPGSKNWSAEVTAAWDETDTLAQATLIEGASVTLNLYPEGNGSGAAYFTGTASVASASYGGTRNGLIEATFSLTGNGALSRTTV